MKNERIQKVAEVFLVIGYLGFIVVYAIAVWQMFQSSIATGLFGVFVPFLGQIVWLVVTGWTTTYAIILYIDVGFLCVGWTMGILSGMDKR